MQLGETLYENVVKQSSTYGGVFGVLTGTMGSGKTTMMQQLAGDLRFWDPKEGVYFPHTVIWRGRPTDYWSRWFPAVDTADGYRRDVRVHIAPSDIIHFAWDNGKDFPLEKGKTLFFFTSMEELYQNLAPSGYNVVYEPSNYMFGPGIIALLESKAVRKLKDIHKQAAPHLFWYELLYFLYYRRRTMHPIAIFMDEADEVFPHVAGGVQFYLLDHFRQALRDIRKNAISVFLSVHSWDDIYYAIRNKCQVKFWFPGSIPPKKGSLVRSKGPLLIPRGQVYIDSSFWDKLDFPPPPRFRKVRAMRADPQLLKDWGIQSQEDRIASGESMNRFYERNRAAKAASASSSPPLEI